MARPLTPKQQRFVEEYLIDLNATQAAKRSGFSARTAYSAGQRLLKNVEIQTAITSAQLARSARVQVTQDYVIQNLVEIVERTMQRAPVMEFDRELKTYVQAKDEDGNHLWMFDANGANKSLGLLAKHTGGFADRTEHTGKDGGPIEVVNADELRRSLNGRIAGLASRIGPLANHSRANGNGAGHP